MAAIEQIIINSDMDQLNAMERMLRVLVTTHPDLQETLDAVRQAAIDEAGREYADYMDQGLDLLAEQEANYFEGLGLNAN